MAIKIPVEELQNTYGVLTKLCNGEVAECMNSLAAAVMPLQGTSAIADEFIDVCRKAQNMYNDGGYVDSLNGILKDIEQNFELGEFLNSRATVGGLASRDLGFESGKIDAATAMI